MITEFAWVVLRFAIALFAGLAVYEQIKSPALVIALALLYIRTEFHKWWQNYHELSHDLHDGAKDDDFEGPGATV